MLVSRPSDAFGRFSSGNHNLSESYSQSTNLQTNNPITLIFRSKWKMCNLVYFFSPTYFYFITFLEIAVTQKTYKLKKVFEQINAKILFDLDFFLHKLQFTNGRLSFNLFLSYLFLLYTKTFFLIFYSLLLFLREIFCGNCCPILCINFPSLNFSITSSSHMKIFKQCAQYFLIRSSFGT